MKRKCISRNANRRKKRLTLLSIAFTLLFCHSSNAQISNKLPIDTNAYSKWYSLGYHEISKDGKYVLYVINNSPINGYTLVLQACNSNWKKEIENVAPAGIQFVNDRFAIFKYSGDSLGIIRLGTDNIQYIPHVKNYKAVSDGNKEWLAIQVTSPANQLIIMDISSGSTKNIGSVSGYSFNPQGNLLFVATETKHEGKSEHDLQLINLKTNRSSVIWEGEEPIGIYYDLSGTQMAFCVVNEKSRLNSICYYKEGMSKATILIDKKSLGADSQFSISGSRLSFSKNGEKIFFNLEKKLPLDAKKDVSDVDIWHYQDKYPRSSRESIFRFSTDLKSTFKAVVDINTKRVINLEDKTIEVYAAMDNNNYLLSSKKSYPDFYYNKESRSSYYLISVNDGARKLIKEKSWLTNLSLSPSEKFVVWFDVDSLNYFSYEIASGIIKNISSSIPQPLYDEEARAMGRISDFGVAGWLNTDDAILIYDRYDIWKVYANGLKPAVNLTNAFGRKHRIAFGLLTDWESIDGKAKKSNTTILLTAFNREKKDNGFWKADLSIQSDPQLLSTGPYSYFIPLANNFRPRVGITGFVEYASADKPIKATNSNRWLVTRMNAEEAPNLFVTDNFKSFKRISNLQPQKDYNWLSAALEKWQINGNQIAQGILYKPENFDSTKKYPLIFTYYEKRSDELNKFWKPDFAKDRLDIPTYVSNGYLVFVPDLYFVQGHNGQSVLDCIVPAVKYLSKFTWVDTTKLALQGHSFAGWVTNYLITHTNIFAAACEAAGVSDQASGYDQLLFGSDLSRQSLYEIESQGSPYGIGITPWTKPELYIENSPIFFINNITTPLLMMHGTADRSVPFEQATEMFLGMKRAGKKVWLLRYPGSGHSLDEKAAKDYTIRMRQFFDHFLKGAPAPNWMTNAVGNSSEN